jgi:PPM family protein phosphatase
LLFIADPGFCPKMTLEISDGMITDIGSVRSENQDSLGRFPDDTIDSDPATDRLFLVADGMGGHKGGKEASRMAIDAIQSFYYASAAETAGRRLKQSFAEANQKIYQKSHKDPLLRGMGTTCTCLAISNGAGSIAHVGDSRAYRVTAAGVVQLTDDHSTVADMERKGLLTKDEAQHHPNRSRLYRALGVFEEVEVDVVENIDLSADQYFVICTDGLYNYLEENELQSLVVSNPPQQACEQLVALANERGGRDNITVQIIHTCTTDELGSEPSATTKK